MSDEQESRAGTPRYVSPEEAFPLALPEEVVREVGSELYRLMLRREAMRSLVADTVPFPGDRSLIPYGVEEAAPVYVRTFSRPIRLSGRVLEQLRGVRGVSASDPLGVRRRDDG